MYAPACDAPYTMFVSGGFCFIRFLGFGRGFRPRLSEWSPLSAAAVLPSCVACPNFPTAVQLAILCVWRIRAPNSASWCTCFPVWPTCGIDRYTRVFHVSFHLCTRWQWFPRQLSNWRMVPRERVVLRESLLCTAFLIGLQQFVVHKILYPSSACLVREFCIRGTEVRRTYVCVWYTRLVTAVYFRVCLYVRPYGALARCGPFRLRGCVGVAGLYVCTVYLRSHPPIEMDGYLTARCTEYVVYDDDPCSGYG